MEDEPGSLQELFDELADQADVETADSSGGVREYLRAGRVFAAADDGAAEVLLHPEIAEAARRTPATNASARGPAWVRFSPPELDDHALDRAEAWFLSAWRAADRTKPR